MLLLHHKGMCERFNDKRLAIASTTNLFCSYGMNQMLFSLVIRYLFFLNRLKSLNECFFNSRYNL